MTQIPNNPVQARPLSSHAEKGWVVGFAVVVMLATSLPYLLGYAAEGSEYRFTGFVFGVEDGNSYIAKMLAGANGDWLFRTPYTAYPQRGMPLYLHYLLLGKLASPPGLHEQLLTLYHLFRFIAGVLAVMATYDFLAFFLNDIRLRRFGLALAVLGGGLGWLLILLGKDQWLGSLPLEFYSPETFGFLGLYGVPHLALARALVLWALLAYLRVVSEVRNARSGWRSILALAILWFLAGLVQPLTALVIGAVIAWHLAGLAVWQIFRAVRGGISAWADWRRLAVLALASGILPGLYVLYNLWFTYRDPSLSAWAAQNIIRSPHFAHYLLAYGLVLPYAWLGGRTLLHRDPWLGWLPVGWVVLFPVLAYLPVDLQRRLPEGVWVAWVVLAMVPLEGWLAQSRRWRLAPFIPLLLLFPSTLLLWLGGLQAARQPQTPLFRPASEVALFERLGSIANKGEVVLASFETSNPLPAWASLRLVIGHGPESAGMAELLPEVAAFYSSATTDAQRLALLNRFGVRYVFWGPAERLLGDWDPHRAAFLQLLDQVGEYAVFRVNLK